MIKQVDIDTQQAREERRVVGTGNTIYEYVVSAITAAVFVGELSVTVGCVAVAVAWAAGTTIGTAAVVGMVVAVVVFVVGMGAFLRLTVRLRESITSQPRDKKGRFVPVYRNGKHEFDLTTVDNAENERVVRWGGGD